MATAGYSGTPMAKKLGIKQGFIIRLINKPDYYFDLFTDLPGDLNAADEIGDGVDFVHFFTKSQSDLIKTLPVLKGQIKKNGIIWVSWPKKASKVATDVRDDIIRNYALQLGLVDIKVCAVDEVWSGLKLVIPLADRMRR